MPDIFTLIALSFSLMLHNAHCIWDVSEPLNHTLNDDGSVNVTCMILGNENFSELDAKLKMNGKYVCEVEDKEIPNCLTAHNASTQSQRQSKSQTSDRETVENDIGPLLLLYIILIIISCSFFLQIAICKWRTSSSMAPMLSQKESYVKF
nr:uncharacterized protein si:ch211-67e16.2 isoform X2 [Danio rerio]|eukprot:XP_005167569.1 uncharacterized protein si:ch211-67e16.2 isoform X2 [Danio rerio]